MRFACHIALFLLSLSFVATAAVKNEYADAATSGKRPRMALVIGNAAYSADPLPNAARDAKTMDERLRTLGYSVEQHLNLNESDFKFILRRFWANANRMGGDAVFFYAGHGVGVGGRNLLIPVDIDVKTVTVDGILLRGIDLLDALGAHQTSLHPDLNRVVILDSCRNDPGRRGLLNGQTVGFVKTDAPSSLIAFSTSLGKFAFDGPEGGNSPFTKHLAKELLVDEIEVGVLFPKVRSLVLSDTNGEQMPEESNKLLAPFVFRSEPAESLNEEEQRIKQEVMLRKSQGLATVPDDKVGKAAEQLYLKISLQLEFEEQQKRRRQELLVAEARIREATLMWDAARKREVGERERLRAAAEAEETRLAAAKRAEHDAKLAEMESQRLAKMEADRAERDRLVVEKELLRVAEVKRREDEILALAKANAEEAARLAAAARIVKAQQEEAAEAARIAIAKQIEADALAALKAKNDEALRLAKLEQQRMERLETERVEAAQTAIRLRRAEEERLAQDIQRATELADREARAALALKARQDALVREQNRVAAQLEANRLEALKVAQAEAQDMEERRQRTAKVEADRLESRRLASEKESARIVAAKLKEAELAALAAANVAEALRIADAAKTAKTQREEAIESARLAQAKQVEAEAIAASTLRRLEESRLAEAERQRVAQREPDRVAAELIAPRVTEQNAKDLAVRATEQRAAQLVLEAEQSRAVAAKLSEQTETQLRKAKEAVAQSERVMQEALLAERPISQLRPARISSDGALLVRGVKLPPDLKVGLPSANVPPACAAFSGGWVGARWADVRTAELWVHSISADCTLSVVYAFGGTSVTGSPPSFQRIQGRVEDGEARLRLASGSVISIRVTRNRTLLAVLKDANGGSFDAEFDAFQNEIGADDGQYAFEHRRTGVEGTVAIRANNLWKPLPDNAPGAAVISTLELDKFLRENPKAVLIDALGEDPHKSISGAILMPDFGRVRFPRAERIYASEIIAKATEGDMSRPIIVFERNTRYGWLGYHSVLRLIGLGYTNIRWYRGGIDAWHDAGFAVK